MAGATLVILGIAFMGYFIIKYGYFPLLGWVAFAGLLFTGSLILWESVPAFIPIKQFEYPPQSCPNCGAIVDKNADVCEKCKQPIPDN